MRALPDEEHRAKALKTGTGKKDTTLEPVMKDGWDLNRLDGNERLWVLSMG